MTFTLDTSAPVAPGVSLSDDTGSSNSDLITSDGTLTLSNIEAAAAVEYSVDGGATWTGSFSAIEGANTVEARQTDVAGNTSVVGTLTFSLDASAPVAPGVSLANDTGTSNSDLITSDGALTLSNIEAGAAVEYSVDGGANWSGSFSAVEGANTVEVRQTDVAGNVSAIGTLTFTLDTGAAGLNVSLSNDTGSSNSDLVTSDGTLTLSNIEAGAAVEYSVDGGATWAGSFSAVEGANTVEARQTDVVGNTSVVGTLTFTLDTSAPVVPGVSLANDTGTSNSDLITSDGTLTLSNIEAGAAVEYSVDGGAVWSGSFSAVEGGNTVEIRQTDVAGNVSAIGTLTFTLDTSAAALGVNLSNDTGSSNSDLITSDGTLTQVNIEAGAAVEYSVNGGVVWTGSFTAVEGGNTVQVRQSDVAGNVSAIGTLSFTLDTSAPLAPSVSLTNDTGASNSDLSTSDGTLTLANIEAGAAVEYSVDGGATWTGSFSAVEGGNTVEIRQTDVAGNVSAIGTLTFTLDTSAAALGVNLSNDTGSSNSDLITSDGALTLSNIETGAAVEYSVDGGANWSGSFSAVQGANTVEARQTDVAGNTSVVGTLTFTLDTSAPVAPGVSLSDDTGSSNSDLVTSDGTLTLSNIEAGAAVEYSVDGGATWAGSFSAVEGANTVEARQSDVAGNISVVGTLTFSLDTSAPVAPGVSLANDTGTSNSDLITSDGALTLSNIEAGAAVEYSVDGGANWSGSFSAVEGANTVEVRQTDVAGNVSAIGTLTFTLDTGAAGLNVSLSNDTGSSNSDLVTSDGTLTLSNIEAGAAVEYSVDGGATWAGSFSAVEGANTVEARQTDVVGNTSVVGTLNFTLDTSAPVVPGVSLANDTGTSNSDLITSDGTLTLSNIEAGAAVEYSVDGGATWSGSFSAVEGAEHGRRFARRTSRVTSRLLER